MESINKYINSESDIIIGIDRNKNLQKNKIKKYYSYMIGENING
jgi:hypothetical protein